MHAGDMVHREAFIHLIFPICKSSSRSLLLPTNCFSLCVSAEKRTRPRLYLHGDRSGEQLHGAEKRPLRGLVHGLHPPRAATERLADTPAPARGPFHEEAAERAAARPPKPPPPFRLHPLPLQSKD